MRDLPLFTTEYGAASLILKEIPYRQEAYIRLQAATEPELLMKDCTDFCRTAGAEKIYATGHTCCESYPLYTKILEMRGMAQWDTEAALMPVQEENAEYWRELCNRKMDRVPAAAYITRVRMQEMIHRGEPYYIHIGQKLLGIGAVSDSKICLIASCAPGAGEEIVKALSHALPSEDITLEVASENRKAVALYERLGFLKTGILTTWYRVR